jgi:hypothetical protein
VSAVERLLLLFALGFLLVATSCLLPGCGGSTPSVPSNVPIAIEGIAGRTDVPTNSEFTYTFSKAVIQATVNVDTFFLKEGTTCNDGTLVASAVSSTDFVGTLTPDAALAAATTYTICLTSGIQYQDGTEFEGASATFTTVGASSSTAATLSPAQGATPWAGVTVAATFSGAITEPADQAAWLAAFALKKNESGAATACTSVTYDATSRVATCVHNTLDANTAYVASINGVKDASGVNIPGASATFTTLKATYGIVQFANYGGYGGRVSKLQFDEPSTGKATYVGFNGNSYVLDYTKTGTYYEMAVPGSGTLYARVNNDFLVMQPASDTSIFFGVLIDPTQTTVDNMIGSSYSIPLITVEGGTPRVAFGNEAVNFDGALQLTLVFNVSSAFANSGVNGLTVSGYNSSYNDEFHLFSQTSTGLVRTIYMFENGLGNTVGLLRGPDGASLDSVHVGSKNSSETSIPSGVAVGDVYNGYVYTTDGDAVLTIRYTVTSISGNALSLDFTLGDGIVTGSSTVTPITTDTWPAGYFGAGDGGAIRFLGANTILFAVAGDSYYFGLMVK